MPALRMPSDLQYDPNFQRTGGVGPGMALQRYLRQMRATPPAPGTPGAPDANALPQRLLIEDPTYRLADGTFGLSDPTTGDWVTRGQNDRVVRMGDAPQLFNMPGVGPVNIPFMNGAAGGGTGADGAGLGGGYSAGSDPASTPDGPTGPGGPSGGVGGGAGASGDDGGRGDMSGGIGWAKGGSVTPEKLMATLSMLYGAPAKGAVEKKELSGPDPKGPDEGMAALKSGEHVWTAEEVKSAGGHQGVKKLRKMAKAGELTEILGRLAKK